MIKLISNLVFSFLRKFTRKTKNTIDDAALDIIQKKWNESLVDKRPWLDCLCDMIAEIVTVLIKRTDITIIKKFIKTLKTILAKVDV